MGAAPSGLRWAPCRRALDAAPYAQGAVWSTQAWHVAALAAGPLGAARAGAAVKADCYGLGVDTCVPALRDAAPSKNADRPMLSLLDWPEMSLSLLHWQDESWIRLRDMPYLLQGQTQQRATAPKSWWRKAAEVFQSSKHLMS